MCIPGIPWNKDIDFQSLKNSGMNPEFFFDKALPQLID